MPVGAQPTPVAVDLVLEVHRGDAGLGPEHRLAAGGEAVPVVAVNAVLLAQPDVEGKPQAGCLLAKASPDLRLLETPAAGIRGDRAASVADVDQPALVRHREACSRLDHRFADVAGDVRTNTGTSV